MRYAERKTNRDDQRLRLGELIERLTELAREHGPDTLVDVYGDAGPAFHANAIKDDDGQVLSVTIFGN